MRFILFVLTSSVLFFSPMLQGQEKTTTSAPSSTASLVPPHAESVIVTGTYEALPLEEADRSVSVYDLPNRVLLFGSFSDLLHLDSSVDFRSRTPGGIQGDISIRGGSYGQTVVLVNGIRLNNAQSAHHNADIPLPIDAVERMEILRGSGSTLYGSDAIGGVVNVITRTPNLTEMRVRGAAGNFGTNQQSGFLSFILGNFDQQFSFERDYSEGFMNDRDYRNLALSSESHLKTKLGYTSVLLAHMDRPFGADQFYGNFDSWERTKAWLASLRQDLGERTEASFAYRRHTDLYILSRTNPLRSQNRHADESYQFALRRQDPIGSKARLFYGAEGLREVVDSTNLGHRQRNRGAGYVNLDVRALRRFSFSIGAREEIYSGSDHFFAPSASAGLWLSSTLKLRASVSRAFRIPNFTDLYYHDPANIGSPDLRPEKATNYEGGVDWRPIPRLRTSVTVFHRREKDGIDYIRASLTDVWRATNFQQLHFTGVESTIAATLPHSQMAEFQYTALRGVQDVVSNNYSKYVFNYPTQQAIASWQIMTNSGWLARTRVGVVDRYKRDAYALVDASVAWTKSRFRPYAQFANLTNTGYEEIIGVRMPGRSAMVGMEILVFSRKD